MTQHQIHWKNAAKSVSIMNHDWFKFIIVSVCLCIEIFYLNSFFNPQIDFPLDDKCGRSEQLVFAPNYLLSQCETKLVLDFESWEPDIYDTLHACCHEKFPNSLTSCCEATGAGGCALSGTVQWLPDWINAHCYEKDTNLIEQWEWRWAHKTVDKCCGRCKYD